MTAKVHISSPSPCRNSTVGLAGKHLDKIRVKMWLFAFIHAAHLDYFREFSGVGCTSKRDCFSMSVSKPETQSLGVFEQEEEDF